MLWIDESMSEQYVHWSMEGCFELVEQNRKDI